MAKTYGVTLPVAGSIYIEVEADNEDDAIEKALCEDMRTSDINEWEAFKDLVRGNVVSAPVWTATAELIDYDEV